MSIESRLRDVAGWLRDIDAEVRESAGDTPTLSFRRGSVLVLVVAFGGDESPEVLRLSTRVVRDVAAHEKPDLMAYLLQQNEHMVFCAFSVDSAGDIWLSTALLAGLDRKDFLFVLSELLSVADTTDDQIVQKWGGERFLDP
jgi:hypothetical protein